MYMCVFPPPKKYIYICVVFSLQTDSSSVIYMGSDDQMSLDENDMV